MRILITTILMAISTTALAAGDGLAICSQCPGTSLVSLQGADTSNARAVARITDADMRNWCTGWNPQHSPAETEECVRQGWQVEVVEASADCGARTFTMDGKTLEEGGGTWMSVDWDVFHNPGSERADWATANFSLMCPSIFLSGGPTD